MDVMFIREFGYPHQQILFKLHNFDPANRHNRFAIAVLKPGAIVGHVLTFRSQ